ncbi:hypothetical protein [Pseudomonas sp.]|nr:hypothetical protein [Pseudomonas sp.]MDX1369298.1 hypothetical protein [Pseudomonas sp.]
MTATCSIPGPMQGIHKPLQTFMQTLAERRAQLLLGIEHTQRERESAEE